MARAGASAIILTDLPRQKALAESAMKKINAEVPGVKLSFMEHDVVKEDQWERVIETTNKVGWFVGLIRPVLTQLRFLITSTSARPDNAIKS